MARVGRQLRSFRRLGYARIALIGVAAAIVLGLLLAWTAGGEFTGRYSVPVTSDPAVPKSADSPPQPVPVTPKIVPPAPRPVAPIDVAPLPMNEDQAQIADAIERATRKALRRGEPVRWHNAGQSGYIVVSEPRDDGERICRNVSATIIGDEGQTESRSHLWCAHDEDEDDWAPE